MYQQAPEIDGFEHWVIPEKIHTFTTEDMLENVMGGGLTALEIQL